MVENSPDFSLSQDIERQRQGKPPKIDRMADGVTLAVAPSLCPSCLAGKLFVKGSHTDRHGIEWRYRRCDSCRYRDQVTWAVKTCG